MALLLHAVKIAWILVVADALFSWVLAADQFPRSLTKPLLDPIYAPIRKVLTPMTGSLDLAPLVLLGVLVFTQRLLESRGARTED